MHCAVYLVIQGSRSDSLHPHTYETSVDLDPQALEAANVTTDARKKDGAVSLDSKVEVCVLYSQSLLKIAL